MPDGPKLNGPLRSVTRPLAWGMPADADEREELDREYEWSHHAEDYELREEVTVSDALVVLHVVLYRDDVNVFESGSSRFSFQDPASYLTTAAAECRTWLVERLTEEGLDDGRAWDIADVISDPVPETTYDPPTYRV